MDYENEKEQRIHDLQLSEWIVPHVSDVDVDGQRVTIVVRVSVAERSMWVEEIASRLASGREMGPILAGRFVKLNKNRKERGILEILYVLPLGHIVA